MESKNWHIIVNMKLENRSKEYIYNFLAVLKNFEMQSEIKDGGIILKENPIYDSFGNLWE